MNPDLWLAFAAATFALVIIPGPTVLLTLSYALSQGRRVALAMVLGVALGDVVAMSASLLGLGALLAASATAFTLVKWIGAAYLTWLAIAMLRADPKGGLGTVKVSGEVPARTVFRHAAIVTALNPKGIAFFVAFVPQFMDPAAPFAPQFAILLVTFVTIASASVLTYALLAGRLRDRIARPATARWLNRAGGGMLLAMAAMTATLKRAT